MGMKYWRKPLKFKKMNLDPRLFFSISENLSQNEPIEQDHHEDQQIERNIEETEDDTDSEENLKKDCRNLLAAHQAQAKWEELYPFAFYSASSRQWFCKICQQCGEGMHWVSDAVHFGEHLKRYLERHQNGITHKNAVMQKQVFQRIHAKGSKNCLG